MDRRIARSTKALKKALVELLEEKTIDEISVTEITERAGYTRKTFYYPGMRTSPPSSRRS